MAQTEIETEGLASTLAGLDTILGVKNLSDGPGDSRAVRNGDKELKASKTELAKADKKIKEVNKDARAKKSEAKASKKV